MKTVAIIEHDGANRKKNIVSLLKKQKGQSLVLVPEKHLLDTYADIGTIFHAGLKQSEKKSIWAGVASGDIQTVIGTQKALFLPYKNPRKIIIDEEQYESYKLWGQYPHLNTIRGARILASITGADIIYASSYPSIALRHAMKTGTCEILHNRPITLATNIVQFSFEDRKFKRAVPDEASHKIRMWARKGLHVLVLYNKKDSSLVLDAITRRLGKQAIQYIHIGTTGIFSDPLLVKIDRVVWLFPEFTMRTYDFRASERARILAARLQDINPKTPILIATRHSEMAKDVFESSEDAWAEKILEERARLHLPPFSDLVRLTIRDKDAKKARQRAITVRELLNEAFVSLPQCKVFGPYQEYGAKKKKIQEHQLLLSGPLDTLVLAYKDLPVDSVDIDPNRIV